MSRARDFANLAGSADAGGITGKNLIINGNFDVWQRGVTIDPVSSSVYGVDRWANFYSSINAQQTFTLGQTDVDGIVKYSSRWTAKTTSGTAPFTRIEDVTRLGGKSITVSFYAKASTQVTVDLRFAQRFGSGGSATAFDTITDALAITTSWQKFSYTRTLASISGKTVGSGNNTEFAILATDLTTNDWIELSQVQLELGEQATPFEHRSYGDELARCQRYYQIIPSNSAAYSFPLVRHRSATNSYTGSSYYPVTMRTNATITLDTSGSWIHKPNTRQDTGSATVVSSSSSVFTVVATPSTDDSTQYLALSNNNVEADAEL